jgi:hypothetical protein
MENKVGTREEWQEVNVAPAPSWSRSGRQDRQLPRFRCPAEGPRSRRAFGAGHRSRLAREGEAQRSLRVSALQGYRPISEGWTLPRLEVAV